MLVSEVTLCSAFWRDTTPNVCFWSSVSPQKLGDILSLLLVFSHISTHIFVQVKPFCESSSNLNIILKDLNLNQYSYLAVEKTPK